MCCTSTSSLLRETFVCALVIRDFVRLYLFTGIQDLEMRQEGTMPWTSSVEVALVCLSMLASARTLTLWDPNTCTKEETFNITKNITVRQPISVKSYKWCLQVPPRCTTHRQDWRHVVETQIVPVTRTVVGCCKGYHRNAQDVCVPTCTNGCTSPPTTTNPVEALQIESSLHNASTNGVTEEAVYNKFNISITASVTAQNSERSNLIISTTNSYGNVFSTPSVQELEDKKTTETITQADHLKQQPKDFETLINSDYQYDNLHNNLTSNIITETDLINESFHKDQNIIENTDTKSEMSKNRSTTRNLSGQLQETPKLSSDVRNTIEQTTAQEHKNNINDSTYSRTPIMHIGERFVYSITISVGIVFAIIIVTLIITKHQRYLGDISHRCTNTRNAGKFNAVHKADEQETSLQVVTYRVMRETSTQPLTDDSTNCSTRNSTILVYNFPPSSSAFDAPPVRTPLRTFGDYDVPPPTTENVYDEIPAHKNTGEAFKCCNNNSTGQEIPSSPFVIQFASLIANDAASTMQPNC